MKVAFYVVGPSFPPSPWLCGCGCGGVEMWSVETWGSGTSVPCGTNVLEK